LIVILNNITMNKQNNMNVCPCGGGQSCIVDRRVLNDWVHEDNLFLENKLPLRKNCFQQYTKQQLNLLNNFHSNNSFC
jgi:hypothetical protein